MTLRVDVMERKQRQFHYEGSGGHASYSAGFEPGTFGSRTSARGGFEAISIPGDASVPDGAQHFFHRKRSDLTPAHSSGLGSFHPAATSDLERAAAGRLDRLAVGSSAASPIRWAGASHSRVWSGDTAGLLQESPVSSPQSHSRAVHAAPLRGQASPQNHGAPSQAYAPAPTLHSQAMESVRQLAELRRSPQCPELPAAGGAQELAALEAELARKMASLGRMQAVGYNPSRSGRKS